MTLDLATIYADSLYFFLFMGAMGMVTGVIYVALFSWFRW